MKKIILLSISVLITNTSFTQNSGWDLINSGTTEDLNAVNSGFIDSAILVCGDMGTMLKSVDSGKTWQSVQTPTSKNLNDIFQKYGVGEFFIAVGDDGVMIRTTDGGNSWTWPIFNSGVTEDLYCIDFIDGAGLVGGDSQTILFCWIDWGETWEVSYTGSPGFGFYGATLPYQVKGFVGGEGTNSQPLIGKTTNGRDWEFISFDLNSNPGRISDLIEVRPHGNLILFASSTLQNGGGAISKTTDEGQNWTTTIYSNSLYALTYPWIPYNEKVYAIGDSGTILKTYDSGEKWYKQQSGIINKLNDICWVRDNILIAVGDNGTILRTTTGGEPVNDVEKESDLYSNYSLEQNYPNPFNPSTKIKFNIPQDVKSETRDVTLKIYDVLGNEVATLVNEDLSPGEYEVEFSAGHESFPVITSGVYLYQLKADDYIETKKMLLIK
jgi:photosystem II stability/assembly factor-like uncharacterized protein